MSLGFCFCFALFSFFDFVLCVVNLLFSFCYFLLGLLLELFDLVCGKASEFAFADSSTFLFFSCFLLEALTFLFGSFFLSDAFGFTSFFFGLFGFGLLAEFFETCLFLGLDEWGPGFLALVGAVVDDGGLVIEPIDVDCGLRELVLDVGDLADKFCNFSSNLLCNLELVLVG